MESVVKAVLTLNRASVILVLARNFDLSVQCRHRKRITSIRSGKEEIRSKTCLLYSTYQPSQYIPDESR